MITESRWKPKIIERDGTLQRIICGLVTPSSIRNTQLENLLGNRQLADMNGCHKQFETKRDEEIVI